MVRTCDVDGCTRQHFGHGLCSMHYKRKARTGSTDGARAAREARGSYDLAVRYTDLRLAVEMAASLLEMAETTPDGNAHEYRDEARAILARHRTPGPLILPAR